MKKLLLSLFLIVFAFAATAQDQKIFGGDRHKIGFVAGYGDQTKVDVDYTYNVTFFNMQYYFSLLRKKTWALEVISQPQFNLTEFRYQNKDIETLKGYEFGLNIGLLARRNFFQDKLSLYTFLSSGPHYISEAPDRQVPGFIFSDNLFIGFNVKAYQKWYFDARLGFRHISNAGFANPNRGINNMIVNGGFFYSF